jgi:hypothetical protein
MCASSAISRFNQRLAVKANCCLALCDWKMDLLGQTDDGSECHQGSLGGRQRLGVMGVALANQHARQSKAQKRWYFASIPALFGSRRLLCYFHDFL